MERVSQHLNYSNSKSQIRTIQRGSRRRLSSLHARRPRGMYGDLRFRKEGRALRGSFARAEDEISMFVKGSRER